MTGQGAQFQESTARRTLESLPMSHLSIELGHYYSDDLDNDDAYFDLQFRQLGHWFGAASAAMTELVGRRPRISTCFLVDDYFTEPPPPSVLIPKLVSAAGNNDIELDYIARESSCAAAYRNADGDVISDSPAKLTEAKLVEEPPPGTTAARPPVHQTGWLSNGQRSPASGRYEAMKPPEPWRPPRQNVAFRHSIFADIQLWETANGRREWSCAMLAAVWQLVRLGLLRDRGRCVAAAEPVPDRLPDSWGKLPPVVRVNPRATPFNAYRTLTVCAPIFLHVEHAVRTILERVVVDPAVVEEVDRRAAAEGLRLADSVVDRIEYLFVDTGPVRDVGAG